MDKVKSERTYYPHVVIGMIIGCVIGCAYTIKIAIDNPVEMDTFYMEKYQKVENNINEIMALQEKFDTKFDLAYSTEKFVIGQNSITLKLTDKSGVAVNNANIIMMLSRPDSNKDNKQLLPSKVENGNYTFGPFEINKPGRWQILSKIELGEFKGYHKNEAYAAQ
ncbi:FixH family protein [Sulfurospirillum diekertiae]|uniref:FixH domain-containing protein n=1 Tax=Sulfurospirillum diekertiae TaxID=1854492 RepID=A0A290HXU4_9BACT|nr:FixH family protein [Sulfurospirillum diekertiae]ATB70480.1 FixH domain-containing protein [Sulfurospirillum diekertiae]QIR75541.1 FixH family protein [Sulfurospirillum diekertiae]QIR78190.1 FixH family protein [Sulfurospirillum diekertiae]